MTSHPFHSSPTGHGEQVGHWRTAGTPAEAALSHYPPNSAQPPSHYGAVPRVRWYLLWSGRTQLRTGGRGCYVAVHCAALPGPWAARAIKDELVELLRNEGAMSRRVVGGATEQPEHSFRELPPSPPVGERAVEVLYFPGGRLKRLIVGLWEKIEENVVSPMPSGNMQVNTSVDGATLGGDVDTQHPAAS